jgi:hypothetical protein
MQPCYELKKNEADLWMTTYVLECVRRYRCTYWSSSLIYASIILDGCGAFSVLTGWRRMEDMQQSRSVTQSSQIDDGTLLESSTAMDIALDQDCRSML